MSAFTAPAPARPGLPRLSDGLAFALLVSIAVVFLAASSIPTPLYAIYGAEWGFSSITVTAIFGVYAVAVLAALLTVGSLSDFVGRRPVLLVAIAIQAAATVLFASADGVASLFAARIVQGLATASRSGRSAPACSTSAAPAAPSRTASGRSPAPPPGRSCRASWSPTCRRRPTSCGSSC